MSNYPARLYGQAMVVPDSGSGAPHVSAQPAYWDFLGNYRTTKVEVSATGSIVSAPQMESLTLRTTFSSVPVVWGWELDRQYIELGEALNEMRQLDEGDEWKIDAPVYGAACYVAAGLMANSFPAPRVFNHGPKSVVFNWSNEADNLYLTISADRVSALISSPERIKRRVDYSANELVDPSLALSSIRAAYTKKPVTRLITGAVAPEPSEFVG